MWQESRHSECDRFSDFVYFSFLLLLPFFDGLTMEGKKLKVQSVFEPSGPPSRSLFRFPRSMRRLGVSWLPPEWEILVIAKLPRSISLSFTDNSPLTLLLQGVQKYYESIVPCTRTQSSTTYVAFQLGSDKNNSQKSLLLFLGKAIFLPHIFFKSLNRYGYSKYLYENQHFIY